MKSALLRPFLGVLLAACMLNFALCICRIRGEAGK